MSKETLAPVATDALLWTHPAPDAAAPHVPSKSAAFTIGPAPVATDDTDEGTCAARTVNRSKRQRCEHDRWPGDDCDVCPAPVAQDDLVCRLSIPLIYDPQPETMRANLTMANKDCAIAADRITEQAARIAALTEDRNSWRRTAEKLREQLTRIESERDAAIATRVTGYAPRQLPAPVAQDDESYWDWEKTDLVTLIHKQADRIKELENHSKDERLLSDELFRSRKEAIERAERAESERDALRADAERWLNLLRGYRKMVNAVAPYFDKPIDDDNVVLWLNLNNAGATIDAAIAARGSAT